MLVRSALSRERNSLRSGRMRSSLSRMSNARARSFLAASICRKFQQKSTTNKMDYCKLHTIDCICYYIKYYVKSRKPTMKHSYTLYYGSWVVAQMGAVRAATVLQKLNALNAMFEAMPHSQWQIITKNHWQSWQHCTGQPRKDIRVNICRTNHSSHPIQLATIWSPKVHWGKSIIESLQFCSLKANKDSKSRGTSQLTCLSACVTCECIGDCVYKKLVHIAWS